MDCKQVRSLLGAYIDGELDARSSLEIEQHLAGCMGCSAELQALRATKDAVKQGATFYRAPADLRGAVLSSVRSKPSNAWRGLGFAACLLVAASGGWIVGHGSGPVRVSDLVAAHSRALMADHLTDVLSTDKHTVKPWFNGKVDFSPPVSDFASQGFPLIGGRLEYSDGRRVAVLVYKRNKHVIDVFVSPRGFGSRGSSTNGFNVISWTAGDFDFAAVSDLNELELSEFVKLVQGQ